MRTIRRAEAANEAVLVAGEAGFSIENDPPVRSRQGVERLSDARAIREERVAHLRTPVNNFE